jgi:hypothetical protein
VRETLKHLNLKSHWHEKVSVTPPNRLRSLTAFSVPLLPTAQFGLIEISGALVRQNDANRIVNFGDERNCGAMRGAAYCSQQLHRFDGLCQMIVFGIGWIYKT